MSNTAALVGAFTAGAGAAALVMTLRGRCCSGGAASSSTAAGGAGGASDGSGTSTGRQPGEKIRFGYWAIRGLAQSVRYLLGAWHGAALLTSPCLAAPCRQARATLLLLLWLIAECISLKIPLTMPRHPL